MIVAHNTLVVLKLVLFSRWIKGSSWMKSTSPVRWCGLDFMRIVFLVLHKGSHA